MRPKIISIDFKQLLKNPSHHALFHMVICKRSHHLSSHGSISDKTKHHILYLAMHQRHAPGDVSSYFPIAILIVSQYNSAAIMHYGRPSVIYCKRIRLVIPVVNELILLLVYAATCFRPPRRLQRGQNHTRWVYYRSLNDIFKPSSCILIFDAPI